jgi:hypothetical protein
MVHVHFVPPISSISIIWVLLCIESGNQILVVPCVVSVLALAEYTAGRVCVYPGEFLKWITRLLGSRIRLSIEQHNLPLTRDNTERDECILIKVLLQTAREQEGAHIIKIQWYIQTNSKRETQ